METEVLIAGAGPTGMTLALHLARQGISCRLLDAAACPPATSRALAVQPRTLELLDLVGLADEIVGRAIPQTGIQLRTPERLLARLPHGQFRFPAVCLPQTTVEEVLRDALAKAALKIEFGVALTGFRQDGGRVTADTAGGPVTARWLVGCDGAHSAVRHAADISFDGAALPETHLMADVEPDWDLDGNDVRVFFHREGALVVLHQPGDVWRLIASVNDPAAVPTEAFFGDVLARRAGVRARRMRFRWMSTFRVHSRLAGTYRRGQIFLAGDAAHVHSPVGGQGMNVGMQDAINLAWKLAEVSRGGPDSLLDTYELERRPVARHVVRSTARLTRIGVGSSPVKRFARDRFLPLVLSLPPVRRSMGEQTSGIALRYSKSPLTGACGGGRAPFRHGWYTPSWELFRDAAGRAVSW